MISPMTSSADTVFLAAKDQRRQHAFISRNAFRFLSCSETETVARQAALSTIPELADVCIVALKNDRGRFTTFHRAFRFAGDSDLLEKSFQESAGAIAQFFELNLPISPVRILSDIDLAFLHNRLSGARFRSGIIARVDDDSDNLGAVIVLRTSAEPPYDDGDCHLTREICDLAAQAMSRTRRLETLKREVTARERMISIAAHELNTPLTALKLQLDLLRRQLLASPEAAQYAKTMQSMERTISGLSGSLGMLFNLSEIKSGQVSLQKEPADFVTVLRDVQSRMEPLLRNAGCEIVTQLPEAVAGYFDRRRIEQAVVNLLANAAKYAPRSRVTLTLTSDGSTARVQIEDTGPGIPESHHRRVFEAFQRAAEDHGVRGLGLGLYIARAVVQAHAGDLKLVSRPGEGAKFMLTLPLWEA